MIFYCFTNRDYEKFYERALLHAQRTQNIRRCYFCALGTDDKMHDTKDEMHVKLKTKQCFKTRLFRVEWTEKKKNANVIKHIFDSTQNTKTIHIVRCKAHH